MTLYEIRNVSHCYSRGRHRLQALSGVNLDVREGEFLAIAGPSGSGKTTLLNILGLLHSPDEGTVRFKGMSLARLKERERTRLRREHIGFIFQTFNLIPVLTAYENVEYFLLNGTAPHAETRQRVVNTLDAVGISAQAGQRPNSLSGGQCQRVAIARALVRNTEVVLADEPTASLDQTTGVAVMDLMKRLNQERGVTFIFSTHDPRILAAAERVLHLSDGRITG
ncbi:MAG TPA: ABC transporter ATP-binding protein [Candidatus Methylomirabilis sp.]